MADTPRTRTELIGTDFVTGQSAGIGSDDARNLIVSIAPHYAAADPAVTDDINAPSPGPYGIGCVWVNTSSGAVFICKSNADGAAVWTQVTVAIDSTAITGGGSGRILFESATNKVSSEANLFWDATNNRLDVIATGYGGINLVRRTDSSETSGLLTFDSNAAGGVWTLQNSTGNLLWYSGGTAGSSVGTERFRIKADGKFGINKSDPGAQIHAVAGSPSTIGAIVQGAASRTAPLVQLKTSAGASLGNVGGTVDNDFTDVASASVDGTEDDLVSFTTVANTFAIDGDSLHQIEHIQFVSSATASRRIRRYFAGTLVFDSGTLTLTLGGDFWLETTVLRESSTVVRVSVNVVTTSASTVPYATYTRITGLTLTTTNIIKTTAVAAGGAPAVADIVEKMSKVFLRPAA